MTKPKSKFLIIFVSVIFVNTANARPKYYNKIELINESDIAIIGQVVEIEGENIESKCTSVYQKVKIKVDSVLFGDVDSVIYTYGRMDDCIGGVSLWEIGQFLIFLDYKDGKYLESNWGQSKFKIKNNKIEWYRNNKGLGTKYVKSQKVIADIKELYDSKQAEIKNKK